MRRHDDRRDTVQARRRPDGSVRFTVRDSLRVGRAEAERLDRALRERSAAGEGRVRATCRPPTSVLDPLGYDAHRAGPDGPPATIVVRADVPSADPASLRVAAADLAAVARLLRPGAHLGASVSHPGAGRRGVPEAARAAHDKEEET